jgi:ribosomal protein S18 acetylase RimI-like enzyme
LNTEIYQVDVQSIIPIRHQVLRKGKPLSTCHFQGDNLSDTFHFAAYFNDEIAGCVSLMLKSNTKIEDDQSYQLRGMAVLENHQNKEIGKHLLKHSEQFLGSKGIKTIWCNVRIKAKPFYSKNGYKTIGKTFEIPDVGPHILMYKALVDA